MNRGNPLPQWQKAIFSSRWFWIVIIAILLFILYSLTTVAQKRYEINKSISEKKALVAQLEEENERLDNLFQYYSSDYYREEIARRDLGFQRPGEEVVATPQNVDNQDDNATVAPSDFTGTGVEPEVADQSNFERWWQQFFGIEL